jgi:hypothetical protein
MLLLLSLHHAYLLVAHLLVVLLPLLEQLLVVVQQFAVHAQVVKQVVEGGL